MRETQPAVIGRLARTLGAQVPGRLVTSAKSWLSHASVDRLAPILPWGADDEVGKVSPVTASASYLAHVRAAWNHRFPHALLEDQDVVLTVPASFDDGARALTLEAARMAKLPALRLLEEPQAAFYDWLFHHRATLGAELAQTRLVLVCDVGGGTTDLTLIKVHVEDGEPQLTRIGVGNHLMLGGDNMDLALAHLVETRLAEEQTRLSAASLSQLVERCRAAKEQLLGAAGARLRRDHAAGCGSAAGRRRAHDGVDPGGSRADHRRRVLSDGRRRTNCLAGRGPRSSNSACPTRPMPAITRHIAAFLKRLDAQSREALGVSACGANIDARYLAAQRRRVPGRSALRASGERARHMAPAASARAAKRPSRRCCRARCGRLRTGPRGTRAAHWRRLATQLLPRP